jgi:Zn-dependent M28 family amino/carboxypeptidase
MAFAGSTRPYNRRPLDPEPPMFRRLVPVAVCTALALSACQKQETPPAPAAAPTPAAETVAADAPQLPAGPHEFKPEITPEDFSAHLRTLASDEFEGRAPGTQGERLTTEYLRSQFESLGLQPGNGTSWFQQVPMVESRVEPGATLSFKIGDRTQALAFRDDMVIGTRSGEPTLSVAGSELVFVGYGVSAPEIGWDDYEGIDVKGKTVIVLINDPGFIRKDPELFKGLAMTYYGRWTYKFEEAARRGAAGALIVHETEAASYGWEVVQNSWGGAQFDLPASEDKEPRLRFQGWIHGDKAKALFAAAGKDFEALRLAADQRGFKPVALGATVDVALTTTFRNATSENVLALLPGSTRKDEVVIYMAHWDHFGRTFAAPDNDKILNGAVDNASGLAGLLETAAAFASAPQKPERSILFLALTLEESGLIGSKYYVNHPVIPLANTVATINFDSMAVEGPARDFAVVGFGQSDLEDVLAEVAKTQDRVLSPEPTPQNGFYFRSDHFNFARAGVPSLYARGGYDLREGGLAAGKQAADDYNRVRYHKSSDEFDPNWNLAGVMQDLEAFYEVGRRVANSPTRPQWRADSEFRAAHEAMTAAGAR